MAGHVFPVWLRFKGGKGVAVAGGAVIALMPLAARHLLGDLGRGRRDHALHVARRRSSPPWPPRRSSGPSATRVSTIVFAAVGTAAVVLLHRGNIRRLLRGEERRIELGRARARPPPGSRKRPRPSGIPPRGNRSPGWRPGGAVSRGFS